MIRRLIVICNALDDETRIERRISTDSPAASRKVFMMCNAVRKEKIRPIVLSLGRGRQDGSGEYFSSVVRRVNRVPVIYLPFFNFPLLSQLFTLIAPAWFLWRLRHLYGAKTILFYNRLPAYTLALLTAFILRFRTVLDLEDGDVADKKLSFKSIVSSLMCKLFDRLCSGGSLLACSALEGMTALRPVVCYYGSVLTIRHKVDWHAPQLRFLIGGTVSSETGSMMLLEAIKQLRQERAAWCQQIIVEITGKGDAIEDFASLAKEPGYPVVKVHRRLTDIQYSEVVSNCHVGLALKPNTGVLANTTFPSKVIELANAGLLILTTNISDVKKVLSNGALYIEQDSSLALIEHIKWIVTNRMEAAAIAKLGHDEVLSKCSPSSVAHLLNNFLFR
jgi:hypothetical protein